MIYDNAPGPVFRPPSEAYSFILRITLGCSHNQCSFCSMYKGTVFTKRDLSDIFALIDNAAKYDPTIRRVFLADGNALCLPTDELVLILKKLTKFFQSFNESPAIRRLKTCWGNPWKNSSF